MCRRKKKNEWTMLRSFQLKRLSLLLLGLTLSVWVVELSLRSQECGLPGVQTESAVQEDSRAADEEDPAKWLHRKLQDMLSPTHHLLLPTPSCPALNSSLNPLPANVPALPNLLPPGGRGHEATLSVLGEVHLRPGGWGHQLLEDSKALAWLGGVSSLIGDVDAVLMNFPTLIQRPDKPQAVLSVLSGLGPRLVVSLANTGLILHTSDNEVTVTARALEGAGIDWLGVHAKKHHILTLGDGQRVGLLAFCGVHRECTDGNTLPFSPVKYSSKAAKAAVKELKEHGVVLVIVLMYWGLEASYFPDETALTIARQLATLGVSAVIGHHPNSAQGHAYFGNTLVIFAVGKLLSSTKVTNYCCNEDTKQCNVIHPNLRGRLCENEMLTRIYRLHLSARHPAVADYVTLRLEQENIGTEYEIRRPAFAQEETWTRACGDDDTQCLACQQF